MRRSVNKNKRAQSHVLIQCYQQRDYAEEEVLPQIKPKSVVRKPKFNLNIDLGESSGKKDSKISEIDFSFKSNKLSLKVFLQDEQRATTPPKRSRNRIDQNMELSQHSKNKHSESFATLESHHDLTNSLQSNLTGFCQLSDLLQLLIQSIKKTTNLDLIESINTFLTKIEMQNYTQLEMLFTANVKLFRQAMLMIRVSVVIIVNSFFDLHFYVMNLSNFKNVLQYNLQNQQLLTEIIHEILSKKNDPLAQSIIPNKKSPNPWTTIRQNTEMLMNLYKQLTKGQRDIYQFLINFFRSVTATSIADSHHNLQQYISFYFTIQQSYQGLLGIPLICVAPQPYLPASDRYTLVLDMDETLIHFTDNHQGGHFLVRPHTMQFLQEMSQHFELVVFTAGLPDYANWVLDSIDKGYISHRLFRQHALQYSNMFIKDLSRLGRPLEKTIIVDNVADNFQNQPDNGIFIKAWYNDPKDSELLDLLPMLRQMVTSKCEDVRVPLRAMKFKLPQI